MKRLLILLLLPVSLFAQDNLTARRPFGQHTVTFSATPVFDAGLADSFKITLTGNVTSSTLIGAEAGHTYTFLICQDGVGARTFAWPSQMVSPIAILAGANVCTQEIFPFDGTSAVNPTTTTAGAGGAGTVAAGTTGLIGIYGATGTTISGDTKLDDGFTTANTLTYTGTGGISTPTLNLNGTGAAIIIGTASTCSGATVGKIVPCFGDLNSNTGQISNNGDSFRSIAVHQSTSPVPHAPMVAGVFPQLVAIPRGAQGQAFCEGLISADPGYCSLNLAGGTNIVQGILPKANHPTSTVFNDQVNTFAAAGTLDVSASTVASAVRVPVLAGLTTALNGAIGYDTTNNMFHGGLNSADSRFVSTTITPTDTFCAAWTRTSGHYELGQATGPCGTPGGAGTLSGLTAATAANSINNGDNAQQWNWQLTTAGKIGHRHSENVASSATGTPFLDQWDTLPTSTANPVQWCAQGTANCWRIDTAALFKPIGTAAMAIPGSAKGVVVSQGPSAAATTVTGTVNQLVTFDGSGNPIATDPIISYNYVNIWTAQDVTVTRTSAAVRNPIFSQTGTLQLTWASITGSPATCTLQIQGVDSVGNALNNGSTFSVSPANGTTSQPFTAAATLQSAAQIKAIFACATYPTTGTLTLDYTPIPNVNGTLADDGAAAGTNRLSTLPAIEQSQLPAAGTAGRNKALRTDLNGTLYTGVMPTNIATYTANKLGLTSAASATDIAVLPGNATNTVIVTRVQVSCTQTTAGIIDLQLIQRTTADTGGTSGAMTAVKMDTGNGAAASAPLTYTANPTINSTVGNYDSAKLACLAPGTAGAADIYVWKPGMGQSIVLRGTAQQLAVNLNGASVTGGSFDVTFSWIETTPGP